MCCAEVAQSCPALCDPMDWTPACSSVHGDSPGKNTGVGSRSLLWGIFPTQGLNPGILHCRWILYQLSYQGRAHMWRYMASMQPMRSPCEMSSLNEPKGSEEGFTVEDTEQGASLSGDLVCG